MSEPSGSSKPSSTRVRTGIGLSALVGAGGHVIGIELADGVMLGADLALVAIGSVPATEWLRGTGLSLSNGVDCDSFCRAAPSIVAAGDVASWPRSDLGARTRFEHRTNATEQGIAAARTLLGKGEPFSPLPYVWTDQFDVKIQMHGTMLDGADIAFVWGDPADGKFAALYGWQGRVVGALGWNAPRELSQLRQHVVDKTAWDVALAAHSG
jgi:NADPH-dependent 2,4-dienoyl-CoA reductase/sulfur reductase-like enzyme